jgi:hypothetical protein
LRELLLQINPANQFCNSISTRQNPSVLHPFDFLLSKGWESINLRPPLSIQHDKGCPIFAEARFLRIGEGGKARTLTR